MTGQVLEISNHGNTVMATRQPRSGARAQIYRFPARTPLSESELNHEHAAGGSMRSYFRLHLAMDAGIVLIVWMIWFGWHQLH